MSRYKLFRLVALLEHDELNSFARFIASPYFNSDALCEKLFKLVRKYHPRMEDPHLEKKYLFRQVFGKEAYNDQKMRRLMMDLSQLLERFFQIRELERSEGLRQQSMIQALGWRGDYDLFCETAEERIASLLDKPRAGKALFLELAQLYETLHFHPGTHKFTIRKDYLSPYVHYLECFFILATLQNEMECRIHKRIVSIAPSTQFADEAEAKVDNSGFDQYPVLQFFHEIFKWMKAPEAEPSLQDWLSRVNGLFEELSEFEQRLALKLLSICALPAANAESPVHENFIFSLYKLGLEHGLLKQGNNPIHPNTFINIANIAAKNNELAWMENFIQQYGPELPESDREYACCIASASLLYHRWMENGDPDTMRDALSQLNLIPTRSPEKYDLRARSTHVRILFDAMLRKLATYDEVMAHLSYFERHLKNSPVYSTVMKEGHLEFLRQLRALAKIANEPVPDTLLLKHFIDSLQLKPLFIKRDWLKGKAEEVLKRSNSLP